MKIILSRKGFDSGSGGCASPILDDGTLVSLPIPDDESARITYNDIQSDGRRLGKLVADLTRGRVKETDYAHFDPDLSRNAYKRDSNWRALFGQCSRALTQLREVQNGDLFLFFGWFRHAGKDREGNYRFVRGARDLRVVFGWLQVGQRWDCESDRLPDWAQYHPHILGKYGSVFVADEHLTIGDRRTNIPGAGVFKKNSDALCLTAPNKSRSIWRLPQWLFPFDLSKLKEPLGSHGNPSRWRLLDDCVELRSVGRGQEFVLNADKYPEAIDWAHELICKNQ